MDSKDWKTDENMRDRWFEMVEENGKKRLVMHSFSGYERNHLYINNGSRFEDVSLVSGMDSVYDSRAHCTLDFDRDGLSDVALVNANYPHLQLFKNQLGMFPVQTDNFLAVRLVGGNALDAPSDEWSCRDGVGTLIYVKSRNLSYVRERIFGEGLAAQNSGTMILGIGQDEKVDLEIKWMSGKSQRFSDLEVGNLVTIYENPTDSNDQSGIDIEIYRKQPKPTVAAKESGTPEKLALPGSKSKANFKLVTSIATWCTACKSLSPQIAVLKQRLADRCALIGLPIDEKDTIDKLLKYVDLHDPIYEVLFEVDSATRENFENLIIEKQGKVSLPSSVLLDSNNVVIKSWLGLPSYSEVAATMDRYSKTTEY